MTPNEIRSIVREVLREQSESRIARLDEAMVKTVTSILISFGIYDEDRQEMRADFQNLRRWRKSVEEAKSHSFRTVVTVIVTGVLGAIVFCIKAIFGN
jgi:ABC-type transporter Mla maintaining outer membrane lipid asymmetry permease subunit MlaE